MASVFDVAAYILKKKKAVTAMKLQKLVYYAQAWSLVWDDKPLFKERIEAWANGPVCPSLYFAHQGEFTIKNEPKGDGDRLKKAERETVDAVLRDYGDRTANWLSELTHKEDPWREARVGVPDGQRSNSEITPAAMAEYYSGL
jgi:uncharacterized phage-associated protein